MFCVGQAYHFKLSGHSWLTGGFTEASHSNSEFRKVTNVVLLLVSVILSSLCSFDYKISQIFPASFMCPSYFKTKIYGNILAASISSRTC